jgi:hypothetical protein
MSKIEDFLAEVEGLHGDEVASNVLNLLLVYDLVSEEDFEGEEALREINLSIEAYRTSFTGGFHKWEEPADLAISFGLYKKAESGLIERKYANQIVYEEHVEEWPHKVTLIETDNPETNQFPHDTDVVDPRSGQPVKGEAGDTYMFTVKFEGQRPAKRDPKILFDTELVQTVVIRKHDYP